jgi:hypothetical protein
MTHLTSPNLEAAYAEVCVASSDMRDHCPLLRKLASRCTHVTEFGVRHGVSTVALLMGCKEGHGRLISYDRDPCTQTVAALGPLAWDCWLFIQGDTREVEIEPTDLLLIDTFHAGTILHRELELHAEKVSKWILLHDTQEWGVIGEDKREGLLLALGRFLQTHPEWKVMRHYRNCCGLTILSRGEEP